MKTFSFTKTDNGLIKITTDTPDGNRPPAQLINQSLIRNIAKDPSYGNKVVVDLGDTIYGDFVLDPAVDTITIGTTTYAPGDLTLDGLLDAMAASTVFQKANSGSGGSGAYSEYIANLSQSGTDDPTAKTGVNTLGGTPVITRDGTGSYLITLADAFPANKTFVFATENALLGNFLVTASPDGTGDAVRIYDYSNTWTLADGLNCSIKIIVTQ